MTSLSRKYLSERDGLDRPKPHDFFDTPTPLQDWTVLYLHWIYNCPADLSYGMPD